ncbi:hypothetical protein U1Q18_044204 [Sarracenia purpurea var. burkii]
MSQEQDRTRNFAENFETRSNVNQGQLPYQDKANGTCKNKSDFVQRIKTNRLASVNAARNITAQYDLYRRTPKLTTKRRRRNSSTKIERLASSTIDTLNSRIKDTDRRVDTLEQTCTSFENQLGAFDSKINTNQDTLREEIAANAKVCDEKIKAVENTQSETVKATRIVLEKQIDECRSFTKKHVNETKEVISDILNIVGTTAKDVAKLKEDNFVDGQRVMHCVMKQTMPMTIESLKQNGIEFNEDERYHPHRHIRLFEQYTLDNVLTERHKCSLFRGTVTLRELADWKKSSVAFGNYDSLKDNFLTQAWCTETQQKAIKYFKYQFTLNGSIRDVITAYEKSRSTIRAVN